MLPLVLLVVLVVAGGAWWAVTRRPSGGGSGQKNREDRTGPGPGSATGPEQNPTPPARPRAAVVVNPTKFDRLDKVHAQVREICTSHGWDDPLWLETTVEDPGAGQTRQALAEGVDLVCALGGDGTVRTVGSVMVDTDVPMGLLSGGTGNLLARNLGLPVTSLTQGLTVALTGRDSRIDTVNLRLRRPVDGDDESDDAPPQVDLSETGAPPAEPGGAPGGAVEDHVFLVMAGLGFDAEVMANAPEHLKKRVGWAAYLVSGVQRLRGPQFKVEIRTDDGPPLSRRVRSIVVGNVGKLTGGVNLLPGAEADDGELDVVLLSPDGIVGWGAVVTRLVTRSSRGHQRVDYYTCETLAVSADRPIELQLDGDTLGLATALSVSVNPDSLIVRRPA